MANMEVDTHYYIIFKCFRIPYYYSILFGWMPIRIPKNIKDKKNKSTWFIPGIIMSLSYIILLIASGNTTKILKNEIKFQGNVVPSNLTIHDRIQIIVGPMFVISLWINQTFTIIMYILMPYNLKGLRNVFKLFNNFFNRYKSIIGDEVTINKMARNVNIESILLIILNSVLLITAAVISFKRIRLSFAWKLFLMADIVIKKLEALSLCIQFWSMCSVLAKCFKFLNIALDRLRIRKIQVTAKPPDLFILSDHFTLPINMVKYLRWLNRAHTDLRSILEHINNVYQILILLSVINSILSMLPHLFVLGIIMAYSNFKIIPQVSMIIWPLYYMMKVYIVCKAASIVSNEAKRTKTILKGAIHKRLTENEKNGIIYFSERIDNKKIKFSLYGLSYLDDEYFLSSLMAVGGYLGIIVQSYMTVIEEQYPIHARPIADKFDE